MENNHIVNISMISGCCCEVDVNCIFLGYYAACSGISLPAFQDNLLVPSSRIKNPKQPKTSVRNYHYMLCNNPEEHSSLVNINLYDNFKCSDWLMTKICL